MSEPCGCRVVELGEGYGHAAEGPTIIYCRTHAAAPDLLAALEEIAQGGWCGECGGAQDARAAIAKYEEEPWKEDKIGDSSTDRSNDCCGSDCCSNCSMGYCSDT